MWIPSPAQLGVEISRIFLFELGRMNLLARSQSDRA